ncbi:hypothetical protein [Agromyces humi]|uniref:hypothetical protein n=1 Tax=Agromyces humi TaxID=1766800 RepID=UPI00135B39A2|nr:hypothetical protein [Agromyces humi]
MNDIQRLLAMEDRYANQQPYPWDDHAGGWVIKDIDGLRVWVTPLAFTFAIIIGKPLDMGYIDRWCYTTADSAVAAAAAWAGPYPGTEPTGWHRHPVTGRRREGGDPACEIVAM